MRIVYVPLEPYEERYTLQLKQWMISAFRKTSTPFTVVEGDELYVTGQIQTGVVLDAHARTFYALSQSMLLVSMHQEGNLTEDDFIYFEDMFHPGIEALAYCLQLSNKPKPKIGVRCLAQTVDADDFVYYTGCAPWMRHYERMVNAFVDVMFINSSEMLPFMTAAGWDLPVVVTGVPFGKEEVMSRASIVPFSQRPKCVSFASRVNSEKQPEFFLALVRECKYVRDFEDITFEFLSGNKIKNPDIDRAVIEGLVEVYPDLPKNEYYKHLASKTRVLFNASLQDWGSVVLPEADALGCNVLFPAYHSFPEVLDNDHTRMYVPWSIEDAVDKLTKLLTFKHPLQGKIASNQNDAIYYTLEVIKAMMSTQPCNIPGAVNPQDTSYRKYITDDILKSHRRKRYYEI